MNLLLFYSELMRARDRDGSSENIILKLTKDLFGYRLLLKTENTVAK